MSRFNNHTRVPRFVVHEERLTDKLGSAKVRQAEREFTTSNGHKPSTDELNAYLLQKSGIRPRQSL